MSKSMRTKGHLKNQSENRWSVLIWVMVATFLLSGCADKKPKVYRVGILIGLDFASVTADGFKAGMAELGYVEGENIVYDVVSANFDTGAYESVVQKFVAEKVDLIFVFPTEACLSAKAGTQGTDIPVVFALAIIEDTGLVESVRKPGGNLTGVRYPGPDIALQRFEIMREIAPRARRIWLPYQRNYGNIAEQLKILYSAAEAQGVTLIEAPADNAAEIEANLQVYAQSDVVDIDFILLLVEPLVVTHDATAVVGKFAAEHKIPIGGMLLTGGHRSVFELNVNLGNDGRDAASLADKILKGTPAGTIPVVSAERFLRIDYTAAQQFGLTVPDGLLHMATQIVR
jgi:putative ABC transport system substrate-binding protein